MQNKIVGLVGAIAAIVGACLNVLYALDCKDAVDACALVKGLAGALGGGAPIKFCDAIETCMYLLYLQAAVLVRAMPSLSGPDM